MNRRPPALPSGRRNGWLISLKYKRRSVRYSINSLVVPSRSNSRPTTRCLKAAELSSAPPIKSTKSVRFFPANDSGLTPSSSVKARLVKSRRWSQSRANIGVAAESNTARKFSRSAGAGGALLLVGDTYRRPTVRTVTQEETGEAEPACASKSRICWGS